MTHIQIQLDDEAFISEVADVVRIYFPDCMMQQGEEVLQISREIDGDDCLFIARYKGLLQNAVLPVQQGHLGMKKTLKWGYKQAAFRLIGQMISMRPQWGSLTGIRPTKLARDLLVEGKSALQARERLIDFYDVSPEKADLVMQVIDRQQGIYNVQPEALDIYIAIPFCPTRCHYCSFASTAIDNRNQKWVEPYLDALVYEMQGCQSLIDGREIRSIYFGGGTPTSLCAEQLQQLMENVRRIFGTSVQEVTVEAGRPDTIDMQKLAIMKAYGTTRISINPQTMQDETLVRIGRHHTADDIVQKFAMARSAGFDHINMDMIAGLEGENIDMFSDSLQQVLHLAPESVTVHTLAVKRTSTLWDQGGKSQLPLLTDVKSMVELSYQKMMQNAYQPYYLYRQKYMAGNLENVGYGKQGHECIYNIDIMEETHSILAFGAGAISKWVFGGQNRIERAPNVRNLQDYIERVDELICRKLALTTLGNLEQGQ